jgi:hypothetical protein
MQIKESDADLEHGGRFDATAPDRHAWAEDEMRNRA